MYLLYSFALSILFVLLLPYFLLQAFRHGKYIGSFKERIGFLPSSLRNPTRPTIWVHTVSVGEFLAARPLLTKLKQEMGDFRLVVSTTTLTGQRLAQADVPGTIDAVFYFPFDWKFSVRRVLGIIQPTAVLILETEIWANFLHECHRSSIITIIVNGRISPRSFSRYQRIQKFIARVLNEITLLIMQSPADAERILALGASPDRVRVCGNLKYDIRVASPESGVWSQKSGVSGQSDRGNQRAEEEDNGQQAPDSSLRTPDSRLQTPDFAEQFALGATANLIVAGSTAEGEEKLLLEAFKQLRGRQRLADARLLLAPRHPERFNEVADLLNASGLKYVRRSQTQLASTEAQRAEVILLDTIGELAATYRFAAVVFVGGSLVPKGGHNILEPALYSKPIVIGPYTDNFRQIIADFAQADAVMQVSGDKLTETLRGLLEDREAAQAMGRRAAEVLAKNRGALDCIFAEIQQAVTQSKTHD